MGLMDGFLGLLFGGGRNVVAETAEVFTVNKERQAQRISDRDMASLAQYAAEFHDRTNRGLIDRIADGMNRLVRPVLTLAIVSPLVLSVQYPETMAAALDAWAVLPSEYWAILGVVIAFYFGGRMQVKSHDAQKSIAAAAKAARDLAAQDRPQEASQEPPKVIEEHTPATPKESTGNAAVDEWLTKSDAKP